MRQPCSPRWDDRITAVERSYHPGETIKSQYDLIINLSFEGRNPYLDIFP